jgi:hypothetical protein
MPTAPQLLDPSFARSLPTPLALAVSALARETAQNGVHTTADELAACVEAFFGLLGRLWVAEYLAAGAPDPGANALLHARLVSADRDPLGGQWIGLARTLREVFVAQGLAPVASELLDLDFGAFGDDSHPVARLSAYRNSFAHGSFHAVVSDIVAHRELLEGVLARLPFLWERPVLVHDGDAHFALRKEAESASAPPSKLTPHHPTFVGADGRMVDLFPLALGRDERGANALAYTKFDKKARGPSPRDIVAHERFAVWAARFERELEGDVEAASTCLGIPLAGAEVERALCTRTALERRGGTLLLVESPPGAPRRALLSACAGGGALHWRVEPGELMGSGLVLARALVRHAERLLGLSRLAIPTSDAARWREWLTDVASRLSNAGLVLRLALEDLHLGAEPARPGEPSVQGVWRTLASGPFVAVGGTVRGWSLRPLVWDARLELGWSAGCEATEVKSFLESRARSPLHRRVLDVLLAADGPRALFAVCDALEASSHGAATVFEPAVERALWDLAPVLLVGRITATYDGVTEEVRSFAPLDRAVLSAARSGAAPVTHEAP